MDEQQRGRQVLAGVLTELKNRGVKDVLIVCIDGLKGFPQAIEAIFPEARVQLCIVHMVRASLNYVNWKERKLVAADLPGGQRAPSGQRVGGVRRQVGRQISGDRETLERKLGAYQSVV